MKGGGAQRRGTPAQKKETWIVEKKDLSQQQHDFEGKSFRRGKSLQPGKEKDRRVKQLSSCERAAALPRPTGKVMFGRRKCQLPLGEENLILYRGGSDEKIGGVSWEGKEGTGVYF